VIDELGRELAAVGIRGRHRDRILSEFADHLRCDPDAELGEPRALAAQFADELGTHAARRAAFQAFGALSTVALAVGGTQAALPSYPDIASGRSPVVAALAGVLVVIGSQIAFAAGSLAALRALRLRRVVAPPAEEVALVRRRTLVGLGAGGAAGLGTALYAVNFWEEVPAWWSGLTLAAAGTALLVVAVAAITSLHSNRVSVSRPGGAEGLAADLGPLADPRLIGAGAVLAMLVLTSTVEGSLFEGLVRATIEAVAFVLCFFAFRDLLGLRR
jgi:hypothetical protein